MPSFDSVEYGTAGIFGMNDEALLSPTENSGEGIE
jgi:hypothetical protein